MYSVHNLSQPGSDRLCSPRMLILAIASAGLLAGVSAIRPVMAQNAGSSSPNASKKISLTVTQAPIRDVLKLLFQSEGITSPINPNIQGNVTVDINEVTFNTALHALLRSTNPPISEDVDVFASAGPTGTSKVKPKQAPIYNLYNIPIERDLEGGVVATLIKSPGDGSSQFDQTGNSSNSIPVNHYDPGMIAKLVADRGSIVNVPPNLVVPQSGASAGQAVGSNVSEHAFIGGSTANFVNSR